MNAKIAAPCADECLERPLLLLIENVAGRVDESDRLEPQEVVEAEQGGVFAMLDGNAVTRQSEAANRRDRRGNGVVAIAPPSS